jgi:hypothetical protein
VTAAVAGVRGVPEGEACKMLPRVFVVIHDFDGFTVPDPGRAPA